jgi:hypothetical protein
MTSLRSKIFRAFARRDSIARIADNCGIGYVQAWSQIRRAVTELDRIGGTALNAIRWQQYLALMRIVDRAFAAFEKSAEEGVSEVASHTIESADDYGKLGLTGRRVSRRVRRDAGDVRFLEVAMKALREIRDLFKIGAEAESKLKAASPDGGLALETLARTGEVRLMRKASKTCLTARFVSYAAEGERQND